MASRVHARSAGRAALVGAGLLAAVPALARDFVAPQGCESFLTVQMHGCLVANHYRCAADAPGEQWDTLFDADGAFFTAKVDREYQWLETRELDPPLRSLLETPAPDPASLSGLIASGADSYEFAIRSEDGTRQTYRGVDRLVGETVKIDGVELDVTRFEMSQIDGSGQLVHRRRGMQFLQRDWRLFFSGVETFEDADGPLASDTTPVQFIFPGEPGFLSTVPLFDCDQLMSQADAPLMEEKRHDQF